METTLDTEVLSPTSSKRILDLSSEVLQPIQEICAIAKQSLLERRLARQPRKRSGSNSAIQRKKLRNGKIMENALEVLKTESQTSIDAREDAYASNYFQKVRATLNSGQFSQFCTTLEELQTPDGNVCRVFQQMSSLFASHPELIEDFIPFLSAEQALECGVFMQHLMLTKMSDFILVLETHFAKTPYLNKRVLTAIETLSLKPDVTLQEVTNTVLPLLKGHPVLTDFFLQLMPSSRPPEYLQTDFDEFDEDALSDGSDEGGEGSWERIELPALSDPYGGATCICKCHDGECNKFRSRSQHCVPCSTKFLNGKVFIQSGKLLRRAQVSFNTRDMDFHRHRLFPCAVEPRKRKRSSSNVSPNKSAYLSSDELKSDDDEKKVKRRAKFAKNTFAKIEKSEHKLENLKEVERTLKIAPKIIIKDEATTLPDKLSPFDEPLEQKESFLSAWELRTEKLDEPNTSENEPNLTPVQLLIMPQNDNFKVEDPTSCDAIPVIIGSENSQQILEDSFTAPVFESVAKASHSAVVLENRDTLEETVLLKTESEIGSEVRLDFLNTESTISNDEDYSDLLTKNQLFNNIPSHSDAPPESLEVSDEGKSAEMPWKIEEDKIILRTLQVEQYCEESLVKISKTLACRTVHDIKSRFQHLMNILNKMKAESSE